MKNDHYEKPRKTNVIAGIVVTVLLIAAAGLGAWYIQQMNIERLQQRIADMEGRIESLQNEQADEAGRNGQQEPPARQSAAYTSENGVKLWVYTPTEGSAVSSPVTVIGQVPGNWSFGGGDFPIELRDGNGNTLAEAPARLHGEWMIEDLVPFTAELGFSGKPSIGKGALILHKSNPGPARNDDSVSIPVKF
jgi:hypothetical protein